MKLEVPEISVAAESHLGLVRRKNEDSFCVVHSKGGTAVLAVVADGIGGHSRGEIASYICCRDLAAAFSAADESLFSEQENVVRWLRETLLAANARICRLNRANLERSPMGTTVVCCVFSGDDFVMASAGDSRFYRLNNAAELQQLSVDHTVFSNAVKRWKRSGAEALTVPGNVIFRAVGLHVNLEVDVVVQKRVPGSRYLLCSDGMYRYVNDDNIRNILMQSASPREVVNTCMRSALMAGGRDNVTVISLFDGKQQGGSNESAER